MANSHDGNAQVLSYPQHPPKDFSDLAATLIKNGLGGVDAETLERHLEQVGYFRLKDTGIHSLAHLPHATTSMSSRSERGHSSSKSGADTYSIRN